MKSHHILFDHTDNDWYNALPLGNGRLGAMVYKKGDTLHIALNHYDVYYACLSASRNNTKIPVDQVEGLSRRGHYTSQLHPRDDKWRPIYEGSTMPYGGELLLKIREPEGVLALEIEQACCDFRTDKGSIHIFIPKKEDRLIVLDPDHLILQARLVLPVQEKDPVEKRYSVGMERYCGIAAKSPELSYYLLMTSDRWSARKISTNEAVIRECGEWLCCGLFREVEDREGLTEPIPRIGEGWDRFFSKSSIEIPDDFLETEWYLQMYLQEASSGRGGRYEKQACGLNGLWDIRRPTLWGSMWYWDVNIQSAFSGCFVTNHMELAQDFCRGFLEYQNEAESFAIDRYEMTGWAMDFPHAYYNSIQPWCMLYLYQYYKYSGDDRFLKNKILPAFESLFDFMQQRFRKDGDVYHIEPDISPEQGPLSKDSIITISTTKAFLTAYLEVCDREQRKNEIRELLEHLPEYPMTEDGSRYIDSALAPEDLWLRHPSMLMPIYPACQVYSESPEEVRKPWINTLKYALEHTEKGVFGFGWLAAACAYMGEGTAALRVIYEQGLDLVLHTNGLAYEESDRWANYCVMTKPPLFLPAMMEPSGGLTAAVCAMLMQEHEGKIEVFPAMPDGVDGLLEKTGYQDEDVDKYQEYPAWEDAAFYHLRASGGVLVSAAMRKGKVVWVQLEAENDVTVTLKTPDREQQLEIPAGGVCEFGSRVAETTEPAAGVQCHISAAHRRVYLGENKDTAFHKALDAWLFAYSMGNRMQMNYQLPYLFDMGTGIRKDPDSTSHRSVSVSEWAQVYNTGWIGLNGTEEGISYGFRSLRGTMWVTNRDSINDIRKDALSGDGSIEFYMRVPAGKYEVMVIFGDEEEDTTVRLLMKNNGLAGGGTVDKGRYGTEEMAVVMKEEGDIRLGIYSVGDKPWKINALLLRKERLFL